MTLLRQYDKVLFLDADMIATGSADDLFATVPAPAGILSTIKAPYGASTWLPSRVYSSYITDHSQCHGKRIDRRDVYRSLEDYGIRGCTLLLAPSRGVYARLMDEAAAMATRYDDDECFVGHVLIRSTGRGRWGTKRCTLAPMSISSRCSTRASGRTCTAGMAVWRGRRANTLLTSLVCMCVCLHGSTIMSNYLLLQSAAVLLHFVTEKPWLSDKDWPDFDAWFDVMRSVVSKHAAVAELFTDRVRSKVMVQ